MEAKVALSMQRELLMAALATVYGIMALALAMLGLYDVTAHAVARRRQEMGVRMCLGADAVRLLRMVEWEVVRLIAHRNGDRPGQSGRLRKTGRHVLFGLNPYEPRIMVGAVMVLLSTSSGQLSFRRLGRRAPIPFRVARGLTLE